MPPAGEVCVVCVCACVYVYVYVCVCLCVCVSLSGPLSEQEEVCLLDDLGE
jgi:hypothetical protein